MGLPFGPRSVPAWLLILVLMELVILVINPAAEDYNWYQQLRRPAWLRQFIWDPLRWLLIAAALYLSALSSWQATRSAVVVGLYLLLQALLAGHSWLLCRSRSLRAGSIVLLLAWGYGLALALALAIQQVSIPAALLLLPLLIWAPLQALALEQMRRLNR